MSKCKYCYKRDFEKGRDDLDFKPGDWKSLFGITDLKIPFSIKSENANIKIQEEFDILIDVMGDEGEMSLGIYSNNHFRFEKNKKIHYCPMCGRKLN